MNSIVLVSPYQLTLQGNSGAQPKMGFLIKLQTSEFQAGYADCFPLAGIWPTVAQLVSELKSKPESTILLRSLAMAKKDGEARRDKINLIDGHEFLYHHGIVTNTTDLTESKIGGFLENGFSKIKIKVGANSKEESQALVLIKELFSESIQLRLDFNGRLNPSMYPTLMAVQEIIDYIEDPFPIVDDQWENLSKIGISLARDMSPSPDKERGDKGWDFQVVKPAKQSLSDIGVKLWCFQAI